MASGEGIAGGAGREGGGRGKKLLTIACINMCCRLTWYVSLRFLY